MGNLLDIDLRTSEVKALLLDEMGAALLAGAGVGLFELITQSTDWAKYSPPLDPNAGNHKRYLELFGFFADVYQRIKELFPRLTPVPGKTESPPNSR